MIPDRYYTVPWRIAAFVGLALIAWGIVRSDHSLTDYRGFYVELAGASLIFMAGWSRHRWPFAISIIAGLIVMLVGAWLQYVDGGLMSAMSFTALTFVIDFSGRAYRIRAEGEAN